MLLRAKTKNLFQGGPLTPVQQANSDLNVAEMEAGATVLRSAPRRIVLELTNACNLNCVMCGRAAADFAPSRLSIEHFYALEPLFDTVEEVTLMGWGEPTIHPDFAEMLKVLDRHSCRKYFCTNGMSLNTLTPVIFDTRVDVFAISVDGASAAVNNEIRRGSDLNKIVTDLRSIVAIKRERKLRAPYMNFVFCAMRRNLHELPALVELAADIGLEEVKAVFLTAFTDELRAEALLGCEDEVTEVFNEAAQLGDRLGVLLKLPYVRGTDPAGAAAHRDCFVGHRDFYLGSDGFVRPCMSTPDKFFAFDPTREIFDMWNDSAYQNHRRIVNTPGMTKYCANCYQSSHCNWNKEKSYVQAGETFAPVWESCDE